MRKIWDIHGGIHPPENKTQSLGSAITPAALPPELVIPLSQHIGAPAKPVVSVGDKVLKGQCIGEPAGFVSVPVHASSSGTVTAIEERAVPHPSGLSAPCIVIATDGEERWCERKAHEQYQSLDSDTLLGIIRNAGIAGEGGAGFPASVKLAGRPGDELDTLIINGTECEPYITADHILMRERADDIARGVAILAQLVKPDQVLFGIEDNKLDVVSGIETALSKIDFAAHTGKHTTVDVITFPTKYPSGGEKQLIEILTGQQVPSGGLPADLGIVCQNVGTAVAVYRAVSFGEPLISRVTTLTGEALSTPQNYEVLLGTPVSHLLALAGFNPAQNERLVMGGPMMGFALPSDSVPVIKTTNCILAPDRKELPTPPPAQACIRCGMCAEACPASLLPQQLFWFAQGKEYEKLEAHNLADCIECGACSYVCPSHIPLVQYYRASKAAIRQRQADQQQADAAKLRFDARQERLERLEREKIEAREARARAAKEAAAKRASESAEDQPGAADEAAAKRDAVQQALQRVEAKKAATESDAGKADDNPVARALARRAEQRDADEVEPVEKLRVAVEKAQARLEKAQQRCADAEASDDPNVGALRTAVGKCEQKIADAKAALAAAENA